MLAQNNDGGKENPLYYISRTMVGVEINYSSMEKNLPCNSFCYSKVTALPLGPSYHFILEGGSVKIYII